MLKLFRKISNNNVIIYRKLSSVFKYNTISNLYSNVKLNEPIVVKGWVKSVRKLKNHVFIDINDGSCTKRLQTIITKDKKPANLTTGSAVIINGHLTKTPNNQLELIASDIKITGDCIVTDGYPFAPRKSYPPDYIRQYLHFRSRTQKFGALLRIRNKTMKAIHDFFQANGYLHVNTPVLTSNDCEGAGEVFTVKPERNELSERMLKQNGTLDESYFNTKVFLTVSGQLHLEAIAHGLGNVYTFGPTFRAENSKSRLHLSEFYMIETETVFVENLEVVLKFVETFLKTISKTVLNECDNDLSLLNDNKLVDLNWIEKSFVLLTYDEAVQILEKNEKIFNPESGLTKEHELFLVNHSGNVPTFVVDFPAELKPFYMKRCRNDNTKVSAFDLLTTNVGEIIGGSLRENDYNQLKSRLPLNMKTELNWYLDIRKFGSCPTAGFGMGFERYLQFLTGITNIKDTIPFPRWPHNCSM